MSANTKQTANDIGLVPGGAFLSENVCKNLETHLESHGCLDDMLPIKTDRKKEGKNGTYSIPMKYIPDPYGDGKEYDLIIYAKDIHVYGKSYNDEHKYTPELKQAKFNQRGFNKFERDDKGYITTLKEGESIDKEDVNYNYRIRELIDQYLVRRIKQFKDNKEWGKGKSVKVLVSNFDLKLGLNTRIASTDEERTVPYITYKFREDDNVISSDEPGRPTYALRILDKQNKVLDVSRDNINHILPSQSKIRLVTSHKEIKISKFGISLTRYINKLRIEETPASKNAEFSFDDSKSGDEETDLNFDDN